MVRKCSKAEREATVLFLSLSLTCSRIRTFSFTPLLLNSRNSTHAENAFSRPAQFTRRMNGLRYTQLWSSLKQERLFTLIRISRAYSYALGGLDPVFNKYHFHVYVCISDIYICVCCLYVHAVWALEMYVWVSFCRCQRITMCVYVCAVCTVRCVFHGNNEKR